MFAVPNEYWTLARKDSRRIKQKNESKQKEKKQNAQNTRRENKKNLVPARISGLERANWALGLKEGKSHVERSKNVMQSKKQVKIKQELYASHRKNRQKW